MSRKFQYENNFNIFVVYCYFFNKSLLFYTDFQQPPIGLIHSEKLVILQNKI